MRYVAPHLLSLFIKKAQNRMMNNMGDTPHTKPKKEGEVNLDFIPSKKKSGKKDNLGDLTDFEEISE